MYLVVGLGNPGRQYEATRHNMGFDVIDRLVEEHRIPQGGVKFNAMYGKGIIEELKYVRMHSTLGYEELKDQGYSEFVLESILYHHENYDGTGYPDNLIGDQIPIGARILRVCDVFAALTSDRPYRTAFDVATVMELMIDEIKNFDMEVFLAFQRIIHNK